MIPRRNMIVHKNISLKNTQISKQDMDKLCNILKSQNINYKCKIVLSNENIYIYKYNSKIKEENPFISDKFDNLDISKIIIESKSCNMQYGDGCNNIISFEGYENDQMYNSLFTQINEWKANLIKTKRINLDNNDTSITFIVLTTIISLFLSIAYFIISINLGKLVKLALITSIIIVLLLILSMSLYGYAFKCYEINIGKAKYKKYQKLFYGILSSCLLPIAIGLIC